MVNRSEAFKLITAGRLIDGRGGPPVQEGAVLIRGSKIVAVGPAKNVLPPEGATVETFDYRGKTVMPGMIDCHTHHNGFGDGRPGEEVAALPDEVLTLQAARNARDSLYSGVTSIRDNGAKNMTMFRLREAVNHRIIQAPRMVLCGRPIAIVGGHMGYFGSEVTGPVEATAAVRQLIKEGADYIKISATGGSTRTSFPLLPAFNPDELRAMTQEAHKFGKLTATHCASTQGTIDSLDAGVDMIIHCVFKDSNGEANFREDVAERIGSQGAYVNPTVHVARADERLKTVNGEEGQWQRYQPGETVRVVSASIRGLAKVIEDGKNLDSKIKVLLDFMGRGVPAVVPRDNVWPIQYEPAVRTRVARGTRGKGRRIQTPNQMEPATA